MRIFTDLLKSTRFLYFVPVQRNFVHKQDEMKLLMFLWNFWTNDWPVILANRQLEATTNARDQALQWWQHSVAEPHLMQWGLFRLQKARNKKSGGLLISEDLLGATGLA